MRIKGHATMSGTSAFKSRTKAHHTYFNSGPNGLSLSSLGIGTLAGSPDKPTNQTYIDALLEAFKEGINVVDTAIHYRYQLSEQAVGAALQQAIAKKLLKREEVVISSKAGFLPFSHDEFNYHYLSSNACRPEDLLDNYHCMAPAYLYDQLNRSLFNLGLETLDIYYLDQPERHLKLGRGPFFKRIVSAFECLEHMVSEGKITCYGVSSWNGFRADDNDLHLLDDFIQCAKAATGSDTHHFRVAQLPFNFGMLEALLYPNHSYHAQQIPFLNAAQAMGITVVATTPLLQGKLAKNLPEHIKEVFNRATTDAQRAIQFTRSAPGITSTVIGMKQIEHIRENSQLRHIPLTPINEFQVLFE